MAGIYAGDANELSLKATFPRFCELEQKYGGLIKGVLAQRSTPKPPPSGPNPTMFMTLRGGLGDLIEVLIKRVESNGATLRLGQQVIGLQKRRDVIKKNSSFWKIWHFANKSFVIHTGHNNNTFLNISQPKYFH